MLKLNNMLLPLSRMLPKICLEMKSKEKRRYLFNGLTNSDQLLRLLGRHCLNRPWVNGCLRLPWFGELTQLWYLSNSVLKHCCLNKCLIILKNLSRIVLASTAPRHRQLYVSSRWSQNLTVGIWSIETQNL